MIIMKLMGGLGNQMFQYACGRALSLHYNVSLLLDHSLYEEKVVRENYTPREYELDAFNLNLKLPEYKRKLWGLHFDSRLLIRAYNKLARNFKKIMCWNEKSFSYDSKLLNLRSNLYCVGYFQSYLYFQNIREKLIKDFSFIETKSEQNKNLISLIQNTENSVSIHVRRGDYLQPINQKMYHTCDVDYYQRAIKVIRKKVKNPVFFVFSADDPIWAKENLLFDNSFHLVGNENTGKFGFENMRLMSLCKHNIIANSSFSWWGAWLNQNNEKVVIAPKKWFLDSSVNTNDLIPPEWIQI